MKQGIRRYVAIIGVLVPLFVGATYLQPTGDRLDGLELRVTVLEATVATLAEAKGTGNPADQSTTNTLTGAYIERPESIAGDQCTNYYPEGTNVFLTDWEGQVLGTGKLGAGSVVEDGLCAQPFQIDDVPEREGYVVYFNRRAPGSAYEFTLEDMQANNWNIEVHSRYRP